MPSELVAIMRPPGDEVAVKPGRDGLVYNGPYSPITDLVLFATGLGVVPMLQMVNELLPSRDSSVSSASGVKSPHVVRHLFDWLAVDCWRGRDSTVGPA